MPKMKMSNLIPEQMQKLATRYRKEWDIDKILAMSKETAIVLQYVPSTRILELFEKAFEKHKYFPNDRELEAVWRSMEASEKKVKGYYDLWGAWIRWGTFYTWMTCPGAEWKYIATNREKELREKYKEGKLTDAEALEWEPLSKKKFWVLSGPVQKPRHKWDRKDEEILEEYLNGDLETIRCNNN